MITTQTSTEIGIKPFAWIDYIGHSNGCRVALDSLKNYSATGKNNVGYYFDTSTGTYLLTDLASNPVDTFVAVACPGNFSDTTSFIRVFNITYNRTFSEFDIQGKSHITDAEIRKKTYNYREQVKNIDSSLYNRVIWANLYLSTFIGSSKLSINIYKEFKNWIDNPTNSVIGKDVRFNNFLVIQGKSGGSTIYSPWGLGAIYPPTTSDKNSDTIIPNTQMRNICLNINSTNKYYVHFPFGLHMSRKPFDFFSLSDSERVKFVIKEFLNTNKVTETGIRGLTFDIILTNQDCGPP